MQTNTLEKQKYKQILWRQQTNKCSVNKQTLGRHKNKYFQKKVFIHKQTPKRLTKKYLHKHLNTILRRHKYKQIFWRQRNTNKYFEDREIQTNTLETHKYKQIFYKQTNAS